MVYGFRDDDEFVIATSISSSSRPECKSVTHRHSRMQHGTPSPPKAYSPRRRPHTAKSPRSRRKIKRHRQIVHIYGQNAKGSKVKKLPRSPYRPPLTSPGSPNGGYASGLRTEWSSICKKAKCIWKIY